MLKKTFLYLFFICSPIIHIAGQSVKARVISNEDSSPLPYATVRILDSDSIHNSTHKTNENGEFSIKIPLNSFGILISYIGFEDNYLMIKNDDIKDINLGTIVMRTDSITNLKEVVVRANSIREDIDKTIVLPTSKQLKMSNSGVDLLYHLQLPGLFVDPVQQKVSIAGTSGVIYRINGINSSQTDVIALKAGQIQRVEYSRTPSARDLDSNSGVINIITKKENIGTHIFTNTLGAFSTGFLNGNINIKSVFSKSELSFDYNVNWRDYDKRWSRESESFHLPDDSKLEFYKKGHYAPFGYLSQNVNASYIINGTKNIFVFKFLNTFYNSRDRNYIDIFENQSATSSVFRNIFAKSNNYIPSLDLYYIRKIDDESGIEANVVGTLMNSEYNRNLTDTYANDKKYDVYNTTDGKRKSVVFETFYYNKKHPIDYNIGLKGGYSHTQNQYNISDISKIAQFNIYPYISIDGKIKYLSYSLGSGVQILHTRNESLSKSYYKNLTTLSLFYKEKKSWSIRNVIRYTPSFPTLSYLNNVDQRQDSLMVVRGNPDLKPSQSISNNLNFSYQIKENINADINLNASKTFSPIRNSYDYDPSIQTFIIQRNNQKYENEIGATFNLSLSSLFKIFNVWSGVTWKNYWSKGIDYSYNLEDFTWYIFTSAQIKNFTIDAGYRKASRDLAGQTKYLNENYSSVSASYKKNNLSLTLGCMFPLTSGTKYGMDLMSSTVQSNKSIFIKDNANMFFVGLSYNISWGKSLFGVNKRLNNSDWDNGIMKIQDN